MFPVTNGVIATIRKQRTPGEVLVMGDGVSGQLGLTMDDGMTEKPRPTLVPEVLNIIDVAAGGMHTVCLTADHKVFLILETNRHQPQNRQIGICVF